MAGRGGFSAERLKRLTAGMQGYVDRGEVAGVVTLVHRRGEEAHHDALGWMDDEARTPMRRDSLFRIASMTKPIASVAALMLMEEGRLRLDSPVDTWLPELADRQVLRDPAGPLDDVYPAPRPITVLDLLTHRPGLVSAFVDRGPIAAGAAALHAGNALLLKGSGVDEWLARLGALPLVHEPGARMNYGFTTDVLGLLVGRVSGLGLERFLQERLFGPLGMTDTGFHVPADKRARLTTAYHGDPATGRRVLNDHPERSLWGVPQAVPSASAGLVSTADDYMAFGRMLLDGGRTRSGERLLSRKTIELMATDFLTPEQRRMLFMGFDMWGGQGFGLGVSVLDNPAAFPQPTLGSIGTYGWGGAFGTSWSNDPAEQMTVVLMVQLLVGTTGAGLKPDFTNLVYQAIDD
jgi:CubicO group peptidase (beta-lactamase class C family)